MLVECPARREHDRDLALREPPQAATDLLASQFQPSEDRPRRGLTLLPLKPHREVPALEPPNLFLGAGFGQNQIQTLPHRCIGWVEAQRRFEARTGAVQIVAAVGDLSQQLEREDLRGICFERPLEEDLGLVRSEEHTSELQSQSNLVCRLLLEKKKKNVCRMH